MVSQGEVSLLLSAFENVSLEKWLIGLCKGFQRKSLQHAGIQSFTLHNFKAATFSERVTWLLQK